MKAAATLLKSVVLLCCNARNKILNIKLFEPKHIRAFMSLGFCTWSCEPPKKPLHLPAAVSFHTGEFSSSWIHAAVEKMRNQLLFCSLWYRKRDEDSIYTSSQVLGVVEKIPGQLLSFVQLGRELCGLHVKCTGLTLHKMFANTVTGLCQHVGWLKELSTTRIHSLNISPFSPCLPSPIKLQ